jgi:hypothetical protein
MIRCILSSSDCGFRAMRTAVGAIPMPAQRTSDYTVFTLDCSPNACFAII